jgi:hypothetical protein
MASLEIKKIFISGSTVKEELAVDKLLTHFSFRLTIPLTAGSLTLLVIQKNFSMVVTKQITEHQNTE